MSDDEIVKILAQNKGEVCGRLLPGQLNRVLCSSHKKESPPFFLKAAAGFLVAVLSGKEAKATDAGFKFRLEATPFRTSAIKGFGDMAGNDTLKNSVRGVVKDSVTHEALLYCTIILKGTNIGTMADLEGRFRLELPDSVRGKDIVIEISCLGYDRMDYLIPGSALRGEKEIVLKPVLNPFHTVGLIITAPTPGFWDYIKHPFSRKRRLRIYS